VGTLVLFVAGVIYAWAFLKPPIVQMYNGIYDVSSVQLTYTFALCFFCLGGLLGGILGKKLCIKIRMLFAGALVAGGFSIVNAISTSSIIPLYLGYGLMGGFGIGLVYNAVIPATTAWFPDKKGVASGVLMLGFGFSSLVLGNLASSLYETSLGWRGTFLVFGIGIGALIAILGLFIRAPREGEVIKKSVSVKANAADYTPSQMLKRLSFYLMFIFFTLLGAVGATAIGDSKNFILSLDANAVSLSAIAAGLISVCNGLGRIICGTLFDAAGMRKTQYINNAIVILAPLCALIAIWIKSPAVGFIALCLCGISYGFSPTLTSAFVMDFYGGKNFNINFPIMTLTLIPASFTSTIAAGMNYTGAYLLLLGMAVVAAIVNMCIKKA